MLLPPIWGRCDVSVTSSGPQFQSHVVSSEVGDRGWTFWEEAFVPLHCTSLTSRVEIHKQIGGTGLCNALCEDSGANSKVLWASWQLVGQFYRHFYSDF